MLRRPRFASVEGGDTHRPQDSGANDTTGNSTVATKNLGKAVTSATAYNGCKLDNRPLTRTIFELRRAHCLGTMCAAKHSPFFFKAVPDDSNATMFARWGQRLDRAFKAVERI